MAISATHKNKAKEKGTRELKAGGAGVSSARHGTATGRRLVGGSRSARLKEASPRW